MKIIIIGAGGHSKSLVDILLNKGHEILGYLDNDNQKHGKTFYGLEVIGGDETIENYSINEVSLVNGVGSTRDTSLRKKIYETFKAKGFEFSSVIHPKAIISKSVELSEGVQVLAGVIIQPDVFIGENSIINTRTSIDHDCKVGNHTHVAPGCTLCGSVKVGSSTHIGTGSTISNNVSIGDNCLVAAGAVVVGDIENKKTVKGIPAK